MLSERSQTQKSTIVCGSTYVKCPEEVERDQQLPGAGVGEWGVIANGDRVSF